MVEYFANSPTCALGNFACALGGAYAYVLARHGSSFRDIASRLDWVKRNKVARTFSNALGSCSSALSGSFANVSSAPAKVASRARFAGLLPGGRLRCTCRLRCGLGLAVLTEGVLAVEGKCECQEHDRRSF